MSQFLSHDEFGGDEMTSSEREDAMITPTASDQRPSSSDWSQRLRHRRRPPWHNRPAGNRNGRRSNPSETERSETRRDESAESNIQTLLHQIRLPAAITE